MQTLNRQELAFLAAVGNSDLTVKVLRLYGSGTALFSDTGCPHLNIMWQAYMDLLKRNKAAYGLKPSRDIVAAGLSETVQSDTRIPKQLLDRCDCVLQRLVSGQVPGTDEGNMLIGMMLKLKLNRRLIEKISSNADIQEIESSLNASKRELAEVESRTEPEQDRILFSPLRDIAKLAKPVVRMPTGINWMDDVSGGGGRAGELWLILGRSSGGKCHGKGTPILMHDGSVKPVERVVVGDRLMGPDGKPRRVRSLARGVDYMYEVSLVPGASFTCNGPHPLTVCVGDRPVLVDGVERTRGDIVDIPAEDIVRMPDVVQQTLTMVRTGVEFGGNDPDEDPYWFGLMLGALRRSYHKRRVLVFRDQDAEVLGLLSGELAKSGLELRGNRIRAERHTTERRYALYDRITDGGRPRIPREFLTASVDFRRKFLAGVLDARAVPTVNGFIIGCGEDDVGEAIRYMANSIGVSATSARYSTGGYRARVSLYGQMPNVVRHCRTSRIRDAAVQDRYNGYAHFSIRGLGKDAYYGFELDGDHHYLLGDFTVTHNTATAVQFSCAQSMMGNDTLWVTYEQSLEGDIAERIIACITDTSLDVIRDRGFANLPKEVQDKFWQSVAGVDDRLHALDMTLMKPDPEDPEDNGGIYTIAREVKKLQDAGRPVKTVIIDWFGSMMSRIATLTNKQLDKCYRFLAQEEINKAIKLAKSEGLLLIFFHQTDMKTQGQRPTYCPDMTCSKDMRDLCNYMDLVFTIGRLDRNSVCWFSGAKTRKGPSVTRTIQLIGDRAKFIRADGWIPKRDGHFYKPGASADGPATPVAGNFIREIE